jgi:hypothetical protein
MGYIVMSAPLRKEAPEWFAPLSYGKDGEIAPDQLLRRGGRATMFETPAAANAAIRATLAKARADGDKWPDKYGIYLLTVEDAPSNVQGQRDAACGGSAAPECSTAENGDDT